MAENAEGQEKSEGASQKKLDEGRDRGQVAKSTDVTTASILLIGGLIVLYFGAYYLNTVKGFMGYLLHNSSTLQITEQNVYKYYLELLAFLGTILLPIMGLIYIIILASEISQVGFKFASKKFTEPENYTRIFKLGAGLKRIFFSSNSLFELGKSLAKVVIIGGVVSLTLKNHIDSIVSIMEKPYLEIGSFMYDLSFELFTKVGLVYIIIALSDYFYQKWKFTNDMKMTKQEVKDEYKQTEGDPKVKGRIRSYMRSRMRKIMLNNVATADVVVTNPTHFSVAIKYENGSMSAPRVVAKGADYLAYKIREKAKQNNIPIVEDPPLARALFHNVEVETEIPEELYKAVAKILAYVYSLKKEG